MTATALPRLLVLTDRRAVPAGRTLLDTLRAAVDAGATALVLRERDLPAAERAALADACDRLLAGAGRVCVVAAP
ncbi:MAG: thiamine phosphate synthase, partial [Mycobacterium sp.]|nr:thiamine phosphate synthase [Mycobacterium sp.]